MAGSAVEREEQYDVFRVRADRAYLFYDGLRERLTHDRTAGREAKAIAGYAEVIESACR